MTPPKAAMTARPSLPLHLGFEIGSGALVEVPVRHLAVTGQTQLSGKTTTLEALVARSGLRAVAFVTKRAEQSFRTGHRIPPYFRERADWQFVSAVLEATLRERLKFERSWIMRACKGARTLADVQENVRAAMATAKGMSADVYLTLDHYLEIVIPQIGRLPQADRLALQPGLNVIDLTGYTAELQALVIRSVLEWVYERETDVLVIVPEAWEFIPQNRGSPVLLACEQLARKGASARNYVWLDSQDIAGVHKNVLRQVGVWILGVQREANEVKRALAHIPGAGKPAVEDVMGLERGQFFVCFDGTVVKTYVQPAWMTAQLAEAIARGESAPFDGPLEQEGDVDKQEADRLRAENERLQARIAELSAELEKTNRQAADEHSKLGRSTAAPAASSDLVDSVINELKRRSATDPGILALLRKRPELEVTVSRPRIEATDGTLYGRLACLIAEGFFAEPRAGNAAFVELGRRGWKTAKPNVYRELDKLASQGFVTKETTGYRAVEGMRINIIERDAAA